MTKQQGSAISLLLGYIALFTLAQHPVTEGNEGLRLFNIGMIVLITVAGLWGGK